MTRTSPGFSRFRSLLDTWDENLSSDKITTMLEDNGFVLFFTKEKEVFGATEDGRLTFARMKNPDHDEPAKYMKEATFSATNLTKAVEGEQTKTVIGYRDLPQIKIISEDEAEKLLKKHAEKVDVTQIKSKLQPGSNDPNIPPNMTKVDEK